MIRSIKEIFADNKKISFYKTNHKVSKEESLTRVFEFSGGDKYSLDDIAAAIFQLDDGKNRCVTKITLTRNILSLHYRHKQEFLKEEEA